MMTQTAWNLLGWVWLAVVVFMVLRWQIGRRLRLRRRREPETTERGILMLSDYYVRPSRRWRARGEGASLAGTPFDE